MGVVIIAFALSFALLVWLKTDAFVEYMSIFGLSQFFHIDEYKGIKDNGYDGNYVDFLVEYYKDKFFVRLLSCPICLSFWLGVSGLFLMGPASIVIPPLTLLFYLVFNRLL